KGLGQMARQQRFRRVYNFLQYKIIRELSGTLISVRNFQVADYIEKIARKPLTSKSNRKNFNVFLKLIVMT
ncbi:MAG: hypothetical protein MUO76_02505, partial [Anaerolineaceae bacterium]|nr:hypothetical protein [Anaerolineaceae bacterium]